MVDLTGFNYVDMLPARFRPRSILRRMNRAVWYGPRSRGCTDEESQVDGKVLKK